MNTDQIASLIRSALKIIGAALVAHGATKAAAIINSEDAIGLAIAIAGLAMSHFNHSSVPPNSQGNPPSTK
jgi:hypothetical protein